MAYNLPPPWDPGFALPANVRDEGLERRAFVTKHMPRGTYDQPKVGTGGYAVPQYVMDEGYGQGTFTTKWRPRGTYDLPVPHWLDKRSKVIAESKEPGGGTKVTFAALSGTELPALYTDFGQRAAHIILSRVERVPAGGRKAALKAILDRIDPTLWKRVAELAIGIQKTGVSAPNALYPALAQAMSTGIAAEVVQAGLRRAAPQPRSLLGLGCYRTALGALPGGGAAVWPGTSSAEQIAGTTTRTPAGKVLQIGPFAIPLEQKSSTYGPANLPAAAYDDLMKRIATRGQWMMQAGGAQADAYQVPTTNYGLKYGWPRVVSVMGSTGTVLKSDGPRSDRYVHRLVTEGSQPIYYFQHPTAGKRYGVYAKFVGSPSSPQWEISWKENEPDAITQTFSFLGSLPAKIIDLVGDVVDAVGNLACKVASSPLGPAAGAAASVAAGAPPEAGAAGAVIAQNICGGSGSGSGVPPGVPTTSSSILPLAIAGGVALVAVVLLKKKKASPP